MHIGLFRLLINYWIGLELVLGGHFGFRCIGVNPQHLMPIHTHQFKLSNLLGGLSLLFCNSVMHLTCIFSSPRLCVSHGLDVFRLKMLDVLDISLL